MYNSNQEQKFVSYYDIKLYEILEARRVDISKYNPTIIEVTEEKLIFGMSKHYGRLNLSIKIMFNQKKRLWKHL